MLREVVALGSNLSDHVLSTDANGLIALEVCSIYVPVGTSTQADCLIMINININIITILIEVHFEL